MATEDDCTAIAMTQGKDDLLESDSIEAAVEGLSKAFVGKIRSIVRDDNKDPGTGGEAFLQGAPDKCDEAVNAIADRFKTLLLEKVKEDLTEAQGNQRVVFHDEMDDSEDNED